MGPPTHVPPGWPSVIPRLSVADPRAMVAFLVDVFGATGTYQESRPSEMHLGGSLIMVAGTLARQPTNAFLYVYVDDTDAAYDRALALGATSMEAPAEMPYGDRRAMVTDPWGNHWQIATHRGFAGGPPEPAAEVFPLVWTRNVPALAEWAVRTLGLTESWRAPPDAAGRVEHAELHWHRGKVSINFAEDGRMGPAGISLRLDDREQVEAIHRRAVSAGANITQGPEETRIAYSFTATDPEGNQWWVNAETGFLDALRGGT